MGKRGPKKTPTNVVRLYGNPGHRPLNRREPQPQRLPRVPEPPPYLNPIAQTEWRRVAPGLHALGLLASIDMTALAAYCAAFARWRQAEDALAGMAQADMLTGALMIRTTSGNAIQNPIVGTANRAMMAMTRFAAEFGMTPAARAGVSGLVEPGGDDPMAQLMSHYDHDR